MAKAALPTDFIVNAENAYGNIAPINKPLLCERNMVNSDTKIFFFIKKIRITRIETVAKYRL